MIAVACLVALLSGAGLMAGVNVTSRSVERSAHKRETDTLNRLLADEHSRTADLLTRLAARSITEYLHAPGIIADEAVFQRPTLLTDPTGLITVDADDETLEA